MLSDLSYSLPDPRWEPGRDEGLGAKEEERGSASGLCFSLLSLKYSQPRQTWTKPRCRRRSRGALRMGGKEDQVPRSKLPPTREETYQA